MDHRATKAAQRLEEAVRRVTAPGRERDAWTVIFDCRAGASMVDQAFAAACTVLAFAHRALDLPYRDPPRPSFS